jgi:nitrogen regulatory protein PII-like uncharacterized protein
MDSIISHGLTLLLGIGVVGAFVVKYASRAKKALKALNEALDVVEAVIVAAEDKAVTEAEFQAVVKEAKEAKEAWVDLVKKA